MSSRRTWTSESPTTNRKDFGFPEPCLRTVCFVILRVCHCIVPQVSLTNHSVGVKVSLPCNPVETEDGTTFMQRVGVCLILVGLCMWAHANDAKPYLRIETGAHTDRVSRIDVDTAEHFLVSASLDKTARVWDLHSGSLLQVLRPPIGDFQKGMLYAVAISPDGRTVAVGGFTGAPGSGNHPIYIFDRDTGIIRKAIVGVPNVTSHLAYSRDGRYLGAALAGKDGVRIYETASYSEVARDEDCGDGSNWIEFDKSGRVLTAGEDGYLRLYDPNLRLVFKEKPQSGKNPISTRFSPDGERIAVGFQDAGAVDVLSAKDLSFQYRLQPPTHKYLTIFTGINLMAAAWSAESRAVCAAGTYSNTSGVSQVLCWGGAGNAELSVFPVAGDAVMDIRALSDGGIAFAIGDGTVGVLDQSGVVRWRAAPHVPGYRNVRTFPRVSSDGNIVEGFGWYFNGSSWTQRDFVFSLADRNLEIDPKPDSSLLTPVTTGLAVEGWEGSRTPTLDGHNLQLEHKEVSRSLAVSPGQDSFVLGTDWYIRRFDRQGKEIGKTAVPDAAWGLNVTLDRRFVVAAIGDGTLRWYNFDKGEEVLALFVDRDVKRWVAWTPDGFFAFEGGGDALVGYQINRGPTQACDFVKVDQLRDVFYRPDLIGQILRQGGAEAVLVARNRVGDVSRVLSGGLPPEMVLISVAQTDEPDQYLVQYRLRDMGGGLGRLVYRIDGVELEARDAVDIKGTGSDTISRYITVGSGGHTLTVTAYSSNGKIESPPMTVQLTGRRPVFRSNLYLIAVGISHYTESSLNAGVRFAAADADLIAAKFTEQEGKGLYPKVKAVSLPDSRATVENIEDAVAEAAKSVRPGDTFVLYLAGHGVATDGEYYFVPWAASMNQQDFVGKSLSREAIQVLLKKIPTSKSVLILDTCVAGAFLGSEDVDSQKAAIARVAVMSGHVVLAAANSREMAIEGYQNHGVFTYALIEGLQAADSDAQGEILITRLGEYVQKRVPQITEKEWHYKQTPVTMYATEPFPIAHKAAK